MAKDMKRQIEKKLDEIPGVDGIILLAGFTLGYNGLMPGTQLISALSDLISGKAWPAGSPGEKGEWPSWPLAKPGGVGSIGRKIARIEGKTKEDRTAEDEVELQKAKLLAGLSGMVEAYAVTRPGSMEAIGSVIQGIGEIVPL